jgi:hypothetical protein
MHVAATNINSHLTPQFSMVYHIKGKNRAEELPEKHKATPYTLAIWRGEVVCDDRE